MGHPFSRPTLDLRTNAVHSSGMWFSMMPESRKAKARRAQVANAFVSFADVQKSRFATSSSSVRTVIWLIRRIILVLR
ncbi:hypothetical protein CERZMDRAFT_91685 [Cercospora zeae-maydis SCOH1-5]|uniref:Uncharacterized protein n=1 Tax=Cercospora zeae-maydis SCOH1-5 TaxID=717836 RepID=A0A6A6F3X3_9PEZI|nr:hypothetical protein CERZMDRAFT_91685 [Cercospora zeae-maydis SCOH1-5]